MTVVVLHSRRPLPTFLPTIKLFPHQYRTNNKFLSRNMHSALRRCIRIRHTITRLGRRINPLSPTCTTSNLQHVPILIHHVSWLQKAASHDFGDDFARCAVEDDFDTFAFGTMSSFTAFADFGFAEDDVVGPKSADEEVI